MMARVDRAAEMRQARELFEFAMRENISMAEARARRAAERHAAAEARLAARRRCGTAICSTELATEDRQQGSLPWYQQEPFA